jgi:hypothetical protein
MKKHPEHPKGRTIATWDFTEELDGEIQSATSGKII